MAKTREIRKRIGSVRNIHKITHTMERVAQSKGMKLMGRFGHAKDIRAGLLRVLPEALGAAPGSLEASQEITTLPLGAERAQVKRILLVCVTSNRGLCGGYNAKVIQAVNARRAELSAEGRESILAVMGRKGLAYFRYHSQPVAVSLADFDENVPFQHLDEAAEKILAMYATKEIDGAEVISTRALTRVRHLVRREAWLPFRAIPAPGPEEGPDGKPVYLVEPDRAAVLAALVPLLLKAELFCVVLEAMVCEQSQRSIAMRSASDNADAMTKKLTRTYNRVRQAQITNEMIEIISGSEGGRS
jgi:F-type H+-transporting ATPase subunit gamma